MADKTVSVKRGLLKLPDDFAANLRALLATPPPPAGTPGSRKIAPPPKAKPAQRKRRTFKGTAPAGTYAYESAPVLKDGKRAKKKAAKKR